LVASSTGLEGQTIDTIPGAAPIAPGSAGGG